MFCSIRWNTSRQTKEDIKQGLGEEHDTKGFDKEALENHTIWWRVVMWLWVTIQTFNMTLKTIMMMVQRHSLSIWHICWTCTLAPSSSYLLTAFFWTLKNFEIFQWKTIQLHELPYGCYLALNMSLRWW